MQELDKKCSAYKEIYTTKVAETRENINRLVNDHCNKFSYVSTLEELGKAADSCYMAILHNINVAAREIKEQQIDLCTLIMEQESLSENDKLLMIMETFGLVGDASAELLDYCRKLKNKIRVGCKYGCMEVFDLGEEFRDLHQEDTEVYYNRRVDDILFPLHKFFRRSKVYKILCPGAVDLELPAFSVRCIDV